MMDSHPHGSSRSTDPSFADGSGAPGLSNRQSLVLAAVVRTFIAQGDPVGSRTISRELPDPLSPATIRNVMADIEDMGLIEQPHTSAGRQPTEQGYRIYIDHIMPREPLTPEDRRQIDQFLDDATRGEEDPLAGVSHALADLTHLLGLALGPAHDEGRFDHLELTPLGDRAALLMTCTSGGVLRSIRLESEVDMDGAAWMGFLRRLHLVVLGRTGSELTVVAEGTISESATDRLLAKVLRSLGRLGAGEEPDSVVAQGAGNVLSLPEVVRQGVRPLAELLEDRRALARLLVERTRQDGVQVTLGSENRFQPLRSMALVTRSWRQGNGRGAVGVLGPTRMPYARLIAIVDYLGHQLEG